MLESLPVFDHDYVATLSRFVDTGSLGNGGVTVGVNGMEVNALNVSSSAVQQIRINQDLYSAKYSRPGRGRIEIFTKPGAQEYRDEANMIRRDAHLNLRNAFAETKPPEQRRIFEGFCGGPLGNGRKTSFMLSANDERDDQQAFVHAILGTARVLSVFPRSMFMRQVMAAAIAMLTIGIGVQAQDGPYHFSKEIAIGGEGGWDYLSVDAAAHRLYVSHATHVVAIDTLAGKVVGDIPDTPGVHGFAIAADIGRGFSSNGRENKVGIIDLKTLKLIQKVDTGENPDAILYEPARKEVYAFNGRGKSATVIDARTGKVVATVPLEGKPESGQADSKAGKVYVNMEDLNAIKVIDTATHKVTDTWPIAPGEAATGMAFDAANHRLFIGCDNKLMLMVDSTNGKMIYSVPVGAGVDSTWFDAATKLAFTSDGESGTVTIAREESPTLLKVVQTLKTRPGARTMALDPTTHAIYLAASDYEPQPAGSKTRPKPVVGTFRVLVYQMK